MAHDVSRALLWLFTFSLNVAQKTLKIPTRYNCTYKQQDLLKALTFISLETEYAQGGLNRLSKRLRRAKQQSRVPSGDTFLYRLKKLKKKTAQDMLNKLNTQVLAQARQKGAFKRKVTLAIDLTFIPYYGKISIHIAPGKPKKGTCYFHCYATLRIVDSGRRFTIKTRPVKHSELDEMGKIVKELLDEAKRCGVHVRLVLLDKGFYSKEVIQTLKASGCKFLLAARRNKNEKEAILDYFRTGKGQVRPFGFSKGEGECDKVCFNLSIHRFKKRKRKRVKNILELYGAFATNLSVGAALRVWRMLPLDYRRRWGIETGYRVDGDFRAKTTSRDETLRLIYYLYMVFLENLWTLHNMGEAKRHHCLLDEVKVLPVKGKEFSEDFVHLLVTACDAGPPKG